MFKGINDKALKKAKEKVVERKSGGIFSSRLLQKKARGEGPFAVHNTINKEELNDYIPHMPDSAKNSSAEVEALKNILRAAPERSSSRGSLGTGANSGVSEAGAGEFVSYKKYTASGRSLASTKVVDLRSYKKPTATKGSVGVVAPKKPLTQELDKKPKVAPAVVDDFEEEDDDAFFRRIFGDEYSSQGDFDRDVEKQKADAFVTPPKPKVEQKPSKPVEDIFSRKVQFVNRATTKKKTVKPKKKKIDIDIISGGTDGDII